MKKILSYLLVIFAFLITMLVFSPITLSTNNYQPFLLGFPRTLWIGLLVSIGYILLTILGANIFVDNENEGDDV